MLLSWEVVIHFADIGRIRDHRITVLKYLFIKSVEGKGQGYGV